MQKLFRIIGFIFCVLYGCFSSGQVSAQTAVKRQPFGSIQPLSIGDKVPDIVFKKVLNYKSKQARLSDFKGKLIILDLWSTWCSACIGNFPKMEALQKKFDKDIQILLVNPLSPKIEPEEKIRSVLKRFIDRTGYSFGLPMPIQDTVISKYFPHKTVPHYIVIDAEGKVVAITNSKFITPANIQNILEGKSINIPLKDDWGFDESEPLLADMENNDAKFVYRAVITGYHPGVHSVGLRGNGNGMVTGYYIGNSSLIELIGNAYPDMMDGVPRSRIILDVRNKAQYSREPNIDYTYCYDLTIPPTPSALFDYKRFLQEDLKRTFNINLRKGTQKMKCLVVKTNENLARSYTKHNETDIELDPTSKRKFIRNYTISDLVRLMDYWFDMPLIDETGKSVAIDIEFPENFDLSNKEVLMQLLKQTGFEMQVQEREIEIVIITDK